MYVHPGAELAEVDWTVLPFVCVCFGGGGEMGTKLTNKYLVILFILYHPSSVLPWWLYRLQPITIPANAVPACKSYSNVDSFCLCL